MHFFKLFNRYLHNTLSIFKDIFQKKIPILIVKGWLANRKNLRSIELVSTNEKKNSWALFTPKHIRSIWGYAAFDKGEQVDDWNMRLMRSCQVRLDIQHKNIFCLVGLGTYVHIQVLWHSSSWKYFWEFCHRVKHL